jgi:hypothetical protein
MAEDRHRRRVAVELNALHWSGVLGDALEGATIGVGTPIHDLGGEVLFERLPLIQGDDVVGHADAALHSAMGTILLQVSPDGPWNEAELVQRARQAADEIVPGGVPPDATVRFVAYSHPKVAIQFLLGDQEVAMLDVASLRPVPPATDRPPSEPPSHHDRWSLLDELPDDHQAARQAAHESRVASNEAIPGREQLNVDLISRAQYAPIAGPGPGTGGGTAGPAPPTGDQRLLHYSPDATSHSTCFEKVTQETSEWCVAASMQMLLGFYRFGYLQERIATDLGLGTKAAPVALPNTQWGFVVNELSVLTAAILQATQVDLDFTDPQAAWQLYRTEVQANRPAISFVWGHSRTVAGYFDQNVTGLGYKGLVVYDPYPATGSGPTYEDIMYASYICAFTATLQLV